MFRDYKALPKIMGFMVVLSLFTSQITYASQTDKSGEAGKTSYKTVEVKRADYTEKSTLKNVQPMFLRNDALFMDKQQATFEEYLVKNGQSVKKGDPLLSYQIPSDSISLEENKLKLRNFESDYQVELDKRKAAIDENNKLLETMKSGTPEAQILSINIQKMEIELEQYKYQTFKSLNDLNTTIKDLEVAQELQYVSAPYDGIVTTDSKVKPGIALTPQMELIHIYDTGSAVLGSKVMSTSKLWYGLNVSIKSSNNSNLQGTVIAADSLLNGKASTGMVYIQLADKNLTTSIQRADVTADTVAVKNVIVIPINAVKSANETNYVNLLDDSGQLRRQYITGRSNGTDMWVYNGLSEGQKIVTE
ncbi:MAG TPA: hypothetical protein VN131_03935 [Mobilitalea sp.]|nr:hypothetical protein [Mobilitalea sp.]